MLSLSHYLVSRPCVLSASPFLHRYDNSSCSIRDRVSTRIPKHESRRCWGSRYGSSRRVWPSPVDFVIRWPTGSFFFVCDAQLGKVDASVYESSISECIPLLSSFLIHQRVRTRRFRRRNRMLYSLTWLSLTQSGHFSGIGCSLGSVSRGLCEFFRTHIGASWLPSAATHLKEKHVTKDSHRGNCWTKQYCFLDLVYYSIWIISSPGSYCRADSYICWRKTSLPDVSQSHGQNEMRDALDTSVLPHGRWVQWNLGESVCRPAYERVCTVSM